MPSPASRFLRLTLSNLQPNFAPIHSVPVGVEAAGAPLAARGGEGDPAWRGAHSTERGVLEGVGRLERELPALHVPRRQSAGAGRQAGRLTQTGSQAGRWIDIKP